MYTMQYGILLDNEGPGGGHSLYWGGCMLCHITQLLFDLALYLV